MKKLLIFSLLAAIFTFGFSTDIQAQSRGKKKKKKSSKTDEYFDDSGNWTQKLWFGAGGTFQIGGNLLIAGLSPMVAYKVTDRFSVGPRITVNSFTQYQPGDNIRLLQLGLGAFTRAKFTESIFAHVEYERLRITELSDFNLLLDENDQNLYGGVGYSSSINGLFSYEILGLYNFMEEDQNRVPINLRIGVTYNF
jgi:long-subunit fatty acid transport protein